MAAIIKQGIDVSRHNGVIDWAKVKASGKADFAFLRGCYGWDNDAQIDPQFYANARGCAQNNVKFGIYHYSYAHTAAEAAKEAAFFMRVIGDLRPHYPVVFDFEEATQVGGRDSRGLVYQGLTPAKQLEVIDSFMQTLEKAGYYATLYSSASALERLRRFAPARLARYDCWVAHIQTQKPAFGGNYGLWQYSWTGKIDGIQGDVDLNYAYKNYENIIKNAKLNGWTAPG